MDEGMRIWNAAVAANLATPDEPYGASAEVAAQVITNALAEKDARIEGVIAEIEQRIKAASLLEVVGATQPVRDRRAGEASAYTACLHMIRQALEATNGTV